MNIYGSVLVIEYHTRPRVEFNRIVEEFDKAFQMIDARSRGLSWDCDDIAIIDRDDLRVALGWLPATIEDRRWHLVIAVGIPPQVDATGLDLGSIHHLASGIAERTQDYLPCSAVMEGEATQPIDADLIDDIFELVRHNGSYLGTDTGDDTRPETSDTAVTPDAEQADLGISHDHGEPEHPAPRQNASPAQVQDNHALNRTDQPVSSEPRRLAIHGLALSLCAVAPPLGAGVLTYTLLRDMLSDDGEAPA